MKNFWESPLVRSRYPLAIVAGLALAGAFPGIIFRPDQPMFVLAWIAPGLMAASALGKSGKESFRIGYVAALTYYLATLYWLLLIPYRWHGIPLGPAAGWLSLGAFLALFPAGWVVLVQSSKFKVQSPQSAVHSLREAGVFELQGTWVGRTLWALSGAAAWVAFEMILTRIFGGFPWDLLGVSQYQMTPLIQIASVTGVYGVSFLIVWFSLSLVSAGTKMLRQPTARSSWVSELFLPTLVVALAFNVGFRHIHHKTPPPPTIRVTLIQPSIPQTVIWDPTKTGERFRDMLQVCSQALTNRTDLLIWPESAVPELLRYDTNTFETITGLARQHHVWMIVGADDAELRPGAKGPDEVEYFNSSFLISPEGRLAERYIKRNLVIFGEFIPLRHWLPFLKWFTPIEGGFTPGTKAVPFELRDIRDISDPKDHGERRVKTSVLICFEDTFPQLGRGSVEPDTSFLINLTNDGWFGEGAAQWQQAATGLFRAVENGVPLIRCTNNGLTCWIDGFGRIREVFRDTNDSIYGPGFMTVDIPVLAPGETHGQTFYNQHGDWFGWGGVGVTGVWLIIRVVRWKRSKALQVAS